MKKYLLLAILTLALVALAACGGGTPEPAPAPPAPAPAPAAPPAPAPAPVIEATPDAEPIVLRVGESLGDTETFIVEAGRLFTERYPHITVEFVNVEVGQAHTQMALDGPAGIGPDLFAAPHDQLGSLVAGGLVLPARDIAEIRDQILGSTYLAASSDGVLFGYPLSAETYAIFYNRDLISSNEVPTTFDELVEWTTDFNDANPGYHGFLFEPGNAYYTIIFMGGDGNRLFGPHGTDASSPNLNTPAAISGMEFMRGLRPILDAPAGDINTGFVDGAFSAGNAAMLLTGPWNINPFSVDAGINLGIAPIPALPGENTPPPSFMGARVMFISAFTHHPEEAHAFGLFLISEEIQRLRHEMTGTIPSIPMDIDSPYFPALLYQLDFAIPMPSIPEMGAFWGAMPAASANIWDGEDIVEQLNMAQETVLGN